MRFFPKWVFLTHRNSVLLKIKHFIIYYQFKLTKPYIYLYVVYVGIIYNVSLKTLLQIT